MSAKFVAVKIGTYQSIPANRSKGGAYDMVCWALVGLISPGLEAICMKY